MTGLRDVFWAVLGAVPDAFWQGFTWLGDSGLLLPASLLIVVLLAWSRATRMTALQWCLVFGAGSVVIAGSKLAFLGWGVGSARLNFTGFSGHTAISTSVWPVLLWLAAAQCTVRRPDLLSATTGMRMAIFFGWAVGAAIGVSRLAVFAHSLSEVVLGFLLGMLVSATFLMLARNRALPRFPWQVGALGLVLPLFVLQPGTPAPTQDLLEVIAMRMAGTTQPFTREDLMRGGR
ncbi:MAG: phosphatase PAP2 family protein [Janthinobacterium lividum]